MKRSMPFAVAFSVVLAVASCSQRSDPPLAAENHLAPSAKSGGDVREVKLLDQCDPDSEVPDFLLPIFAQLPFTPECVEHPHGSSVDLEEFFAALPEGGHGGWKIDGPGHVDLDETLLISNEGGVGFGHTFTPVAEFGGTCLPAPIDSLFNQAVSETSTPPECASVGQQIVLPGETRTLAAADLGIGHHKLQCLVHPWMRLELEVRAD